MAQGDRGKWAEGRVRGYLVDISKTVNGAFLRLPDARSGSFQPTTADFLVNFRGLHTMLEVKEVEHDYRLPGKNFKPDQRARLTNWRSLGTNTPVVVAHMPLKEGVPAHKLRQTLMWRCVLSDWFGSADVPSWDLREFPLRTLDQAMEIALC
jgi:hypothetical protein